MKTTRAIFYPSIALLIAFNACSDDAQNGTDSSTGAQGTGAGTNTGGAASTTGSFSSTTGMGGGGSTTSTTGSGIPPAPTVQVPCGNQFYECGDLIDNDADGLLDYQDPDCLGACDNTEDSLYGGIPGQPGPPCKIDCYWDADSGPGNDDCYWDHGCDTHEVPPDYYPEPSLGDACEYQGPDFEPFNNLSCSDLLAAQSDTCDDICGPVTPNGCDCFGCCELPAGSGKYVWSGSEGASGDTACTWDKIDDPTVCHPCDPVPSCMNPCDPCEICIGKPLPGPECGSGGGGGGTPTPECEEGITPCGTADLPPCPAGFYCITGCCQAVVE
jgi:hypothetical protein